MADETVDIDVNVNTNTDQAEGSFKRLQSQIRETTTLLQEAEAAGDAVSFKKYKSQLDDLQDQLEITNLKQQQFDDTLAAAPGPLGKAGQAVKAFDGAMKFLAANPVIAILAGLAAILFAVKAALDKSAKGTEALSKVTEAFGNIVTPIIDFIAAVAVPVLEAYATAINAVASFLGLVNEEQVKSQKEYRQYAIDVKKANAALQNQIDVLEAKGNKEAEIAKKSKEIIDGEIKLLEKKRAAFGILTAEEEAQLVTLQGKKAVIDAKEQTRLAKVAEDAKKAREEESKNQIIFTKKLEDISTESIANGVEQAKQARANKYREDLVALETDLRFIKMSDTAKNLYRSQLKEAYDQDIAKINRDAKIKEFQDELDILQAQRLTLLAGTDAYLANALAIEENAYQQKILAAEGNAKKLQAIETEHEANIKNIRLQAAIAEKQIQLDRLAVISSIGSSLGQLAGKNKALAIAAITIEKAAAIGSIVANVGIANLKAVAASPLTLGQPWVTINTISGALAAAATIAAGIKAIQEINAVQVPGSTAGSGGSGGSTAAPAFAAPAIGAPQIGATSAQTGTIAGIAAGTMAGNNSTDRPLQTYVVGNQITTQQQLDRRLRTMARLGG